MRVKTTRAEPRETVSLAHRSARVDLITDRARLRFDSPRSRSRITFEPLATERGESGD